MRTNESIDDIVHSSVEIDERPEVLVVEDDLDLLETYVIMLETAGYHVHTASDGVEALAVYEKLKDRLRLISTDGDMPNMDGFELLKELQKRSNKVPVILASARSEVDYQALGFVDRLKKPALVREYLRMFKMYAYPQ